MNRHLLLIRLFILNEFVGWPTWRGGPKQCDALKEEVPWGEYFPLFNFGENSGSFFRFF
jgi:hypothetical protein